MQAAGGRFGTGRAVCGLATCAGGGSAIVIERGKNVDYRAKDVEAFWAGGSFKQGSNVQFGEGGAGAFSDGKLTTGIKDPRCREVLNTLYRMGAPEEILYLAKPHIGTDHLRNVVKNLRNEIIRLGGEVRFENEARFADRRKRARDRRSDRKQWKNGDDSGLRRDSGGRAQRARHVPDAA